MLKNKVIVYDDSCPMCRLYTYWFVAWGFLKSENRIGFAKAPEQITRCLDLNRGRHEIPLFDRSTGETIYGLAALTHILGSRWTWLRPVFRTRLFWWTCYPLYQIITFNRRVIAGCKHCDGFDCAPDLNRFYRSVYLIMAISIIGLVGGLLAACSTPMAQIGMAVLAAFTIVGTVSGTLTRVLSGRVPAWNYAGNFATSTLIVALVMLPMTLELVGIGISEPVSWVALAAAVLFGMNELRRREL